MYKLDFIYLIFFKTIKIFYLLSCYEFFSKPLAEAEIVYWKWREWVDCHEENVVSVHASGDANPHLNKLFVGVSQSRLMTCGTRNYLRNEPAWERVTVAHAQIKNYTASAEPSFLFFAPWLKEALFAGYISPVSAVSNGGF